ncbi:hypothetical protein [Streptomyces milbemycinicus]|uniref:hypothetical protein n=1 Tax=Streptomyces milbemycinicus TaxID=476552 RepID=UPI0033D47B05
METPPDPGGAVKSPFGKGMAKEAETLKKFKGRIDEVLSELEKSPASKKKIDAQTLSRGVFGGDLTSAEQLYELYNSVHEKLKTWSKTFGDQIEAMGLAALIAEKGYDELDAEQRRRMQEIQAEAQKYYRDPTTGKSAGSDDSKHSAKSVGPDAT